MAKAATKTSRTPKAAIDERRTQKRAPPRKRAQPGAVRDVEAVLRELKRHASPRFRADMARRYGIVTRDETFGTPMAKIKAIAKPLGRDHAFAETLWRTGIYEARMLASMVDDPERVTAAQMDRWVKDCDNWATVDTLCFNLFDRTPHVFSRIPKWATARGEFVKRAAFALLASAALHGRGDDADYLAVLPVLQRAATDDRNFVKKGVSWALRAIGSKKSPKLRTAARTLARDLAASVDPTARWIGKDALRAFTKSER